MNNAEQLNKVAIRETSENKVETRETSVNVKLLKKKEAQLMIEKANYYFDTVKSLIKERGCENISEKQKKITVQYVSEGDYFGVVKYLTKKE